MCQSDPTNAESKSRLRSDAFPLSNRLGSADARMGSARSIYIVDDEPGLIELYSMLLEVEGYVVRGFSGRTEALAALAAESNKPALLVTDYLGHAMPLHEFLRQCQIVHPEMRILVASGLHYCEADFSLFEPHAFIRKPFTADAFLLAVGKVLSA